MLDPDYMSDITPARKRLFEIITGLVKAGVVDIALLFAGIT